MQHTFMRRAAAAALAGFAFIHLRLAPGDYREHHWMGLSFAVGGMLAILAAAYLLVRNDSRVFTASAVLMAGFFVGFVLTRTTGLFGVHEEEWETLGLISMAFEAGVVGLFAAALVRRADSARLMEFREVITRAEVHADAAS